MYSWFYVNHDGEVENDKKSLLARLGHEMRNSHSTEN